MLLSTIIIKFISIHFPNSEVLIYAIFFLLSLMVIIAILISTAYYTLLERKLLSAIQSRVGPSKVGYFGLLQPLADGLKLFFKEIIFPTKSFKKIFIFSCIFSFFISLNLWAIFDFSYNFGFSSINLVFLLIFLLSMFHVYSIIFAGWASNSKYSFLGALRSSAQLIGYDIALVLTILNLFIFTESLSLEGFLSFQSKFGWLILWFPLNFVVFYICVLAETNRHPFDLPEAEAELVAGYNVEYSAISFALFFLAEYSSMIFMSVLTVHIFFGGWVTFANFLFINTFLYFLKIGCILYSFIFVRALIPRYRYDQLMRIGWKILIPFQIVLFFYYILISYFSFDINSYIFNNLDIIKNSIVLGVNFLVKTTLQILFLAGFFIFPVLYILLNYFILFPLEKFSIIFELFFLWDLQIGHFIKRLIFLIYKFNDYLTIYWTFYITDFYYVSSLCDDEIRNFHKQLLGDDYKLNIFYSILSEFSLLMIIWEVIAIMYTFIIMPLIFYLFFIFCVFKFCVIGGMLLPMVTSFTPWWYFYYNFLFYLNLPILFMELKIIEELEEVVYTFFIESSVILDFVSKYF